MNAIECLVGALRQSLGILDSMLTDLKDTDYDHIPCWGANNLRWIMGHLADADRQLLVRLGARPPEEMVSFERLRNELLERVVTLPASELDRHVDAGPLANTLGVLLSLAALHTMLHAGQVSTIRRSLGYPPVF
ncbi:MAG: DinB family protein [Planctomycetota bacterium]